MNESFEIIQRLREKAEKILLESKDKKSTVRKADIEQMIHELEVHQIELQLQNTELEESRRNLEESQSKYFNLYENAPIGFLTINDVSKIIELNYQTAFFLKDDKLNIVGKYFSNFIAPESQDDFYFHIQKIIRTGESTKTELKIIDKFEKRKTILMESKPLSNDKEMLLIYSVLVDISNQKHIESELELKQHTIELIEQTVSYGIFAIDENFKFIEWSNRCEHLTGYHENNIIGRPVDTIFDLKYSNIFKFIRKYDVGEKPESTFEAQIIKKNGQKLIALVNLKKIDSYKTIVSIKDITKNKYNEQDKLVFDKVLDNINEPLIIIDKNTLEIEYTNKAILEMFDIEIDMIKHQNIFENDYIVFEHKNIITLNDFINDSNETLSSNCTLKTINNDAIRINLKAVKYSSMGNDYIFLIFKDLQETLNFEKKLAITKDQTSKIIDKTPVGVCVTNKNGIFEYVNNAYCSIYKYKREELIGSHFTMVVGDDLKEFMKELHDKFIAETAEPRGEWQVVDKFGNTLYILADAARITDLEGNYQKVTFVVDITEAKKSEKKLIKSEERFRRLTENAGDIIYKMSIKPEIAIDYVSPAVEKVLGYTPEEIYSNTEILNFILDLENELQKNKNINNDKEAIIRKVKNKNGDIVWIEDKFTVVKDEYDEIQIIEGVARDITFRKLNEELNKGINNVLENLLKTEKVEDILRELLDLIEAHFSNIIAIIKIVDNDTHQLNTITSSNNNEFTEEIAKITALYPFEGAYGKALETNSFVVVPKINESELFANYYDRIKKFGYNTCWSMPISNINGESFGALNFYFKNEQEESPAFVNIISTTAHLTSIAIEMFNSQKQLKDAKAEAELANKIKSEFLANISHEIRTPMNAILGFTELLKYSSQNDNNYYDYIEGILVGGKSLMNLINDILDLSKIEAGRMDINKKPFDIRSLLKEIEQLFSIKASNKSLQFVLNIDSKVPEVIISDEVRLRQILFNLVGNAIKFTDKGVIAINVCASNIDESKKIFDLEISVVDTGIGIPKLQHEAIFESFRQQSGQSEKKYEGTGLGLSISKRLVEMLDGSISLESKPNEGSKFTIALNSVGFETKFHEIKSNEDDYVDVRFFNQNIMVFDQLGINSTIINGYTSEHNLKIHHKEEIDLLKHELKTIKPKLLIFDASNYDKDWLLHIRTTLDAMNIPIILIASHDDSLLELIEKDDKIAVLQKPFTKRSLFTLLSKFLKYAQVTNKRSSKAKCDYLDGNIYKKELYSDKVRDELQNRLKDEWKQAKRSMIIDRIKKFARDLKEFAETHKLEPFVCYADEMLQYLEIFNIERIIKIIPYYENMIEIIEQSEAED